jgi:hypothetical protein
MSLLASIYLNCLRTSMCYTRLLFQMPARKRMITVRGKHALHHPSPCNPIYPVILLPPLLNATSVEKKQEAKADTGLLEKMQCLQNARSATPLPACLSAPLGRTERTRQLSRSCTAIPATARLPQHLDHSQTCRTIQLDLLHQHPSDGYSGCSGLLCQIGLPCRKGTCFTKLAAPSKARQARRVPQDNLSKLLPNAVSEERPLSPWMLHDKYHRTTSSRDSRWS